NSGSDGHRSAPAKDPRAGPERIRTRVVSGRRNSLGSRAISPAPAMERNHRRGTRADQGNLTEILSYGLGARVSGDGTRGRLAAETPCRSSASIFRLLTPSPEPLIPSPSVGARRSAAEPGQAGARSGRPSFGAGPLLVWGVGRVLA